jgi:uncharacterized repeat protein (TIGR01451 family)
MRQRRWITTGFGLMAAIALAVLGGAAVSGQAAVTQQVTAEVACQPATVKPGRTTGCLLTVSNNGGNNVTKLVVTDTASGGTFLSPSSSKCITAGATLTCDIGKLTGVGTAGSSFTVTYELQVPASGTDPVVQTVTGKFAPNPNNRASDTIEPEVLSTQLDDSADFDGRFANAAGESVQTSIAISGDNPYSTAATVQGTTFAAGLAVREEEEPEENNINCPATGCLGGQVIEFSITPLAGVFPTTFTLTVTIAGEVVGNGTKEEDLDVRHDGAVVPLCPATDPVGACIADRDIAPSTKIATIVIVGLGNGNGGWGFG